MTFRQPDATSTLWKKTSLSGPSRPNRKRSAPSFASKSPVLPEVHTSRDEASRKGILLKRESQRGTLASFSLQGSSQQLARRAEVSFVEEVKEGSEEEDSSESQRLQVELYRHVPWLRPPPSPPKWAPPWVARSGMQEGEPGCSMQNGDAMYGLRPGSQRQMLSKILEKMLPTSISEPSRPPKNGRLAHGTDQDNASAPKKIVGGVVPLEDVQATSIPSPESSPTAASQHGQTLTSSTASHSTREEVALFKALLLRNYGNLVRAFRTMKNVVNVHLPATQETASRRASPTAPLTVFEFQWYVTSYLHLGDRNYAKRLSSAFDADMSGEVGISELSQPQGGRQEAPILSFSELHRRLSERPGGIQRALREFEDSCRQHGNKLVVNAGLNSSRLSANSVSRTTDRRAPPQAPRLPTQSERVNLVQFKNAVSFCGLEGQQAVHFFNFMDKEGSGLVSLTDFTAIVADMPRSVLLQEFWFRLLMKNTSLTDGLRDLDRGAIDGQIDRVDFVTFMSKQHVAESDSRELFALFDSDNNGSISSKDVREALREVAPQLSLEDFWQRFAAEWPELVKVARECSDCKTGIRARRRFATLIEDLLPQELRPIGSQVVRSTDAYTPHLWGLTFETFDALAALIDVSQPNAINLFMKIVDIASPQRSCPASKLTAHCPSSASVESSRGRTSGANWSTEASNAEILLEDFAEQLHLSTENIPARHDGGTASSIFQRNMTQAVAPARAVISALKAELQPTPLSPRKKALPSFDAQPQPPSCPKVSKPSPKLTWLSYYTPISAMPVFS